MAYFQSAGFPSLLLGPKTAADIGYVAYLLPQTVPVPEAGIDLGPALTDPTLGGSFLFSPHSLDFAGDTAAQRAFADRIWGFLSRSPTSRGVVWIASPQDLLKQTGRITLPFLGLDGPGAMVASGLSTGIGLSLGLLVSQGMSVALSGDVLTLDGSAAGAGIIFTGSSAPTATTAYAGGIPFDGPQRGGVGFQTFIQRQSLYGDWNWGFQFLFPQDGSPGGLLAEWLPLADGGTGPTAVTMIGFDASIDPADPFNAVNANKTILFFTGSNQDQTATKFVSFYRTVTGNPVTLGPLSAQAASDGAGGQTAGLVFASGRHMSPDEESFTVGPQGDFLTDAPTGPDGVTAALLGGLHGTEFFTLVPGSTAATATRLRFTSGQPALAPDYPPPTASPVGKPSDPNARLLQDGFRTSWATLVPAAGQPAVVYVSQPKGSPLYGHDTIIAPGFTSMLGAVDPGSALPAAGTPPFPLVPYAGVAPGNGVQTFSGSQTEQFETLVVGPTRRTVLGRATTRLLRSARMTAARAAVGGDSFNTTTPSGLIATVTTTGGASRWSRILLGRTATPTPLEMAFLEPTPELQQAFQTSQLCLVVANGRTLVDPASGRFANRLNIENWILEADAGASPGYGDYANVMIVKGIKGPLYDAADIEGSLVANPSKWTQRDVFAAPTLEGSDDPPDNGQLVNLSQWLQDYFKDAAAQDNAYFATFNRIARDSDWTGILVLRATIAEVPDDLKGITAGISDPTAFYAHHFAVEISQVRQDGGTIDIADESSVFGLIHYTDPAYDEANPRQPVTPTAGQTYDYRVLTLKVLFENTGITSFSSRTQLTLNSLFASPIDHMGPGGNGYNTIILSGTYQNNHGTPVYSMASAEDWTFYFDSPVLNKVEITNAQMVTLDPGSADTDAVIWFGLTGFMDFLELGEAGDGDGDTRTPFDVFSFGNPRGSDGIRQGLAFRNLGLRMSYPTAAPETRTIVAVTTEMAFDMQTSTPRPNSLYTLFALTFEGLVTGEKGKAPKDLGYLDVITDLRLTGVGEEAWFALRFRLNMGTPGQLAGDVGLASTLLTAWAPGAGGGSGDSYPASVNLALPGTGGGGKLISLQTVLSLSIGLLRLTYDAKAGSFLLMMTEIALKFLGLLKIPPNGSTSFYLFGNPGAGGKPSGLGWYAIYNNEPKERAAASVAALSAPRR